MPSSPVALAAGLLVAGVVLALGVLTLHEVWRLRATPAVSVADAALLEGRVAAVEGVVRERSNARETPLSGDDAFVHRLTVAAGPDAGTPLHTQGDATERSALDGDYDLRLDASVSERPAPLDWLFPPRPRLHDPDASPTSGFVLALAADVTLPVLGRLADAVAWTYRRVHSVTTTAARLALVAVVAVLAVALLVGVSVLLGHAVGALFDLLAVVT